MQNRNHFVQHLPLFCQEKRSLEVLGQSSWLLFGSRPTKDAPLIWLQIRNWCDSHRNPNRSGPYARRPLSNAILHPLLHAALDNYDWSTDLGHFLDITVRIPSRIYLHVYFCRPVRGCEMGSESTTHLFINNSSMDAGFWISRRHHSWKYLWQRRKIKGGNWACT